MSVNLLFKIAAVGILVSVLGQVLKHSGREEQAYLASLAGLVLVLFRVLPYISQLFASLKELFALWSKLQFLGLQGFYWRCFSKRPDLCLPC